MNLREESELDFMKCFFCQLKTKKNGKQVRLSVARSAGISTLKNASRQRKEFGEIKQTFLNTIKNVDLYLNNDINIPKLKWHYNCYQDFTAQDKVERLLSNKKETVVNEDSNIINPSRSITRSKVDVIDWKLCMFCQENLSESLTRVMEMPTSTYIMDNAKLNRKLFIALSTASDCMAEEAMYHLKCYSSFRRLIEKTDKDLKEEKNIDYALHYILDELRAADSIGDVVRLDDVWERYSYLAKEYNAHSSGSYKDKHTFSICLKNKLEKAKSSYEFFNKFDSGTIMFPTNFFKQGISSVIDQNDKELEESLFKKCPEYNNDFLSMVHVALKLRSELEEKPGHEGLSITDDAAIGCIPDNLYIFLSLLFGGTDVLEIGENEYYERGKWTKNVIMSIAQDIIFGVSKGKKWTPKHIGLTSTLHQKTRSKDLVNLFYNAGHCVSYENLLKLDKTLAEDTLKSMDDETGAIIPPNLVSGKFVHFSADNIDIHDESLTGQQMFHATQLAAYQRIDREYQVPLSHIKTFTKKQKINIPEVITKIPQIPIQNDKLSPFIKPFSEDLFSNCELNDSHIKAKAADNTLYFIRQDMDKKMGWTEFNQQDNQNCSSKTAIGHMPMILNPAHEYDTINLAIRRCMAISAHFEQEYTLLTVDQQLYCKIHPLISNTPEFQNKVFPRLGGLHISLNFQKILGKHMSDCGLHEAWIESGLLGEVATQRVSAGKEYSKAMRAHKITIQALWRKIIPKFMDFLSTQNPDVAKVMNDEIKKYRDGEKNYADLMSLLQTDEWREYLSKFVKEESEKSVNFSFWWKYMEMVSILLMFTRAQRDGDWELYLTAFRKIIPFFFPI